MGSWQERLALCWHEIYWQTIYYSGKSQGRQMSRGSKIIVAWTCRTVPQRIKSGQHVTPETLTGYSMYRKLLPKFLDMIDMSLLDDERKEAYKQSLTSRLERISKSADSTKKCSNDNLKSAQTTVSIKHCILTEKVFVRLMAFIIFG